MKFIYQIHYRFKVHFTSRLTALMMFFFWLCISAFDASAQNPFITTWKTDNPGSTNDNQIRIPASSLGYNYTVDWGDGSSDVNVAGAITHTYAEAGTYTVSISGDFPGIYFFGSGEASKIVSIEQWGDIQWGSMTSSYRTCVNMVNNASDAPDLSNVTSLSNTFYGATLFNGDLSNWDVSTITNLGGTFNGARAFNGDISSWDVSNVTNMSRTFMNTDDFNVDISGWNVSQVTSMQEMFTRSSAFNQDISSWDVSGVTNMAGMFQGASSFTMDISGWDVSNVSNMASMFLDAILFNQDLSGWNVAKVTDMSSMFYRAAAFDGDVSTWDVGAVTNMNRMFYQADIFTSDISAWNVSNVTDMVLFLSDVDFYPKENYDKLLKAWSQLPLQDNVGMSISATYCNGAAARQSIIDDFGWSFGDLGQDCEPFITTWKTDNTGTSNSDQITIPTTGTGYNYSIDWGDGNTDTGVTGDITHTYASTGTYTVSITGDFPRIFFNGVGDPQKILTIEQWGDIEWTSMEYAFRSCVNLVSNAIDAPDLSQVTSLKGMFASATGFTGDLNSWDVSTITSMSQMFNYARAFNGDISSWDVSNVVAMDLMFYDARVFDSDLSSWDVSKVRSLNQTFREARAFSSDLSNWDVSSVIDMNSAFWNAFAFNSDISSWDVSNVTKMSFMFYNALIFNQDISSWDVSKVTTMYAMFTGASVFNQPLNSWNVSNVTSMGFMFNKASDFNQNLSSWDVSKVTDMRSMFHTATQFNQDLSSWNVGNVSLFFSMFESCTSFNGDVSSWDLSSAQLASRMFFGCSAFNQDISGWNVSSITDMSDMFNRALIFNQDLSGWNVSSATTMSGMFYNASAFDSDLSGWDVSNVTNMTEMFDVSGFTQSNYENALIAWSGLALQNDVVLGGNGLDYCEASDARQAIIDNFSWTINDGDEFCEMIWDGTAWSNGTAPGAGSDDVIIAGDYNTADDGILEVKSITINAGVTFTVAPDNYLYVVGDITNNGSLIVESGADLMSFESGNFSGNDVIIKRNTRYADGRYSFVGTPVQQTSNVTNTTVGSHVYTYDETQSYDPNDGLDRWVAVSGELIPGVGYTQAMQQEIVFEGVPNVGTVNVMGTYTGTYDDATNEENEGWVFVSNPYATAIDVEDFLAQTNIEGAVYIWDDNGSDTDRGTNSDYIIANGTVATNTTPAGGQTRFNGNLGSGQGFFVKLADDVDTEITFTPGMRVTGSNADENFFRSEGVPAYVRVNLTNSEGLFKQAVVGRIAGINDQDVDRSFDAKVFSSKGADMIYTTKGGHALAIQGISYDREAVTLAFNVAEAGVYSIDLDLSNANGEHFFLKDNYTGKIVNLSSESYSFTSNAGQFVDRFELLANARVLGVEESKLQVYAHDQIIYFKLGNGSSRQVDLIDINGQKLWSKVIKESTEIETNLPAGVYLIMDGERTHKILLK